MAKRDEAYRKKQAELDPEATFQPKISKAPRIKEYYDELAAQKIKEIVDKEWYERNHVDQDAGNMYSKAVSDFESDDDKFEKDLRKVGY